MKAVRRPPLAAALLLAASAVAALPSAQPCRIAWRELTPECFLRCEAFDDRGMCRGTAPACASRRERCEHRPESGTPTPASSERRAWCVGGAIGGLARFESPEDGGAPSAIVPESIPDLDPGVAFALARLPSEDARPPTGSVPAAPIRGPPAGA